MNSWETLSRELADPCPHVRRVAVDRAGFIVSPYRVPLLCRALKDPDRRVRLRAAEGLLRRADERAVNALCAALTGPDEDVRQIAVEALRRIGDPRALPGLLTLIRLHPSLRRRAAAALDGMEGRWDEVELPASVYTALGRALVLEDPDVVCAVARVFADVARPEDVETLSRALRVWLSRLHLRRKVSPDRRGERCRPSADACHALFRALAGVADATTLHALCEYLVEFPGGEGALLGCRVLRRIAEAEPTPELRQVLPVLGLQLPPWIFDRLDRQREYREVIRLVERVTRDLAALPRPGGPQEWEAEALPRPGVSVDG